MACLMLRVLFQRYSRAASSASMSERGYLGVTILSYYVFPAAKISTHESICSCSRDSFVGMNFACTLTK